MMPVHDPDALLGALHGGPDALGVARHDFSVNSNSCGPCPMAVARIAAADATRYPDPAYHALRLKLAAFHGVDARRIVLASGASEFIARITALAGYQGRSVWVPHHAYGDYRRAAEAHGLPLAKDVKDAGLIWHAEPDSPFGRANLDWDSVFVALRPEQWLLLDCAYAPLRLEGVSQLTAPQRDRLWQVWTPNKALGLVGVRGAYAVAPSAEAAAIVSLNHRAPSWVLGAHAVAMLDVWTETETQNWLEQSRATLRQWKARQVALIRDFGWRVEEGVANFMVVRHPGMSGLVASLRAHDIKLRDTSSFGVPDAARLGVLAPEAQDALATALAAVLAAAQRQG